MKHAPKVEIEDNDGNRAIDCECGWTGQLWASTRGAKIEFAEHVLLDLFTSADWTEPVAVSVGIEPMSERRSPDQASPAAKLT